jgi:peptide/nickel transport system substrate-binding protein
MRYRLGVKLARFIALAALIGAGMLPATASAGTGQPLVLKIGTDQDLETLNPWQSITVADYEIFQIQYELLMGYDINLETAPGFAESFDASADQKTFTFHIRPNMKWSDGKPATCDDALYTYQFALDALADEDYGYVGSGYLEPSLSNAGLESVECTDPLTFVAKTSHPTTILAQAYVPILPKHIWSKYTLEEISNAEADGFFKNEPPVVGSGPYVVDQWEAGNSIHFKRNDNYWGTPGVPDEIVFQKFKDSNTMVQALKNGELDYVRGTGADQFDALQNQPDIRTSEGFSNGFTYLSFNTRATQKGYHGSTSALEDQKFRDALGFAIDRQTLVDRVLNGHGVVGSTHIPPYQVKWHVEPTTPRTFNIDEANTRLDAAGYKRGADDKRVDKDGKPITLRLTWPDSEDHATDAQFIQGWWEQLGITVDAFVTNEGKLLDDLLGPETDGGPADWDAYMWGWVGDPDPTSLLSIFQTSQIESGTNDCFYSDPKYDELFETQLNAVDETSRKAAIAEMQNLFYDAACYHVLYYDSFLDAQRTDKFTNWVNQPPDSGTPIFGYGYVGYMQLQDASAVPTPGPTVAATTAPGASGGAATPAPSGVPASNAGAISTPVLIGALIVILVIAGGFLLMRRRGPKVEEE